ncbi:BTB/POZ protein [Rhizophagus clarus]|uniref:BTB/POZ protein n=1 Tax=Rhizophagus clarus TaxID=94130 RepID=A0A8H3R109_9GLOM|nr:BTB/POZ protein [Rhizophagus clarus]
MDSEFLQKLSQNLIEILDDDEYYDTIIEVGNDPYNDGTLVQIKLPNISPDIFQIILRYIYGGKISLEDYDNLDIIKILIAANELNLQELVIHIQSFLTGNKADWMEQNFNLIYQTSFENNSFLELQKYCTDLISKAPDKLFKSQDFSLIPEKIIISLIQSDYLQMSETQVWENVVKWGLAQNPGLSSDPSIYSKEDFSSLKNTLQKCIPFIRFYNLTSKEFLDYVLPYREILPEELYMDLLKTFLSLNPNSKPTHKSSPRIPPPLLPHRPSYSNPKPSSQSTIPHSRSSYLRSNRYVRIESPGLPGNRRRSCV